MDVEIDISENVRFIDKVSVLGVASKDGRYKKNIILRPRTKRRILKYSSQIEKIYASMVHFLIEKDIDKYSSLKICCDVSKNKLKNYLRKLFKDNNYWIQLDQNKKIKIAPVGNSFVDRYVKDVRKKKLRRGKEIKQKKLESYLKTLER